MKINMLEQLLKKEHPKATLKHISKALKDEDVRFRRVVENKYKNKIIQN